MGLAFYYGAIKPNFHESAKAVKTFTPVEQTEYTPPLPLPTPKGHK